MAQNSFLAVAHAALVWLFHRAGLGKATILK